MPIPTPEPPVTRYRLEQYGESVDLHPRIYGDWCKWEDVEALLLQRAQEIAELKAELREVKSGESVCICEIDRHDFNCPVHNDSGPSRRGPNGDE